MFFPHREVRHARYVQVVENRRIDGEVRQSIIATLGRTDELGLGRLAVGIRGKAL